MSELPMQPDTVVFTKKAALRKQVLSALKTLSPDKITCLSRDACDRMLTQTVWRESSTVLGYAPMAGELDIWPLLLKGLLQGKTIALLRFHNETGQYLAYQVNNASDVVPGQFRIREPASHCREISLNRLDLILVPGVAFDSRGRRLGRGKGYYDRVLPAARGVFCGVAFDQQVVGEVPVAPHDAFVSCILTPTRWIVAV